MPSLNNIPVITQGVGYTATWTLVDETGVPVPLTPTIDVTLWRDGEAAAFLTATLANSKLSSINAAGGSFSFNLTAADLVDSGSGFGACQVKRTGGSDGVLVSCPLRLALQGETQGSANLNAISVQVQQVTVTVTGSPPAVTAAQPTEGVPYLTGAGRYHVNSVNTTTFTAVAGVADRMELAPWVCPIDMAVDRFGVIVSAGVAAASGKIVCYDADGFGRPADLQFETAPLSFAAAGFVEDVLGFTFRRGALYWLGVRHSSTANLNSHQPYCTPVLGYGSPPAATANKVLRRSLAFATAAPDNWGYNAAEEINTTVAAIFMRVA